MSFPYEVLYPPRAMDAIPVNLTVPRELWFAAAAELGRVKDENKWLRTLLRDIVSEPDIANVRTTLLDAARAALK